MRGNKMQETMAAKAPANRPRNKTRIQKENEERILLAALEVFSQTGFHGATLDKIASAADMSKPNLLYYFKNKEEIHIALLTGLLDVWLAPLRAIRADGDPATEIGSYIRRKLESSREYPRESRLFANEIWLARRILVISCKASCGSLSMKRPISCKAGLMTGASPPVTRAICCLPSGQPPSITPTSAFRCGMCCVSRQVTKAIMPKRRGCWTRCSSDGLSRPGRTADRALCWRQSP